MALNTKLTNTFKDIIVKEDLIDTGALLRSVRVFVDIKQDVVQINIVSKYYVKYLTDKYNLVRQFVDSKSLITEVELELQKLLDIKAFNIFNNTKGTSTFEPRVILLINGR